MPRPTSRKRRPSGNPKKNTLRDLYILRSVLVHHDVNQIPSRVDGGLLTSLAREHKMTARAVAMAIHRLRKLDADPAYEAPRAFRGSAK